MTIREPWDSTLQPAPRFYLTRPLYEKPYAYFRAGIPKELRKKLQSITNRELVLMPPNEPPIYDKEYRQLLGESRISEDVCFWLPERPKLKARLLTRDSIEPQMSHYFPWLPEELLDVPFCTAYLEDSQVVSTCRSVRIILEVEEAGIETAELYRRKGYAFHALAEWAETIR